MSKSERIGRAKELMIPIDEQIMMCDNIEEVLMLASCMLVSSKLILTQHLGGKETKNLLQKLVDNIDERILPVGRDGWKI